MSEDRVEELARRVEYLEDCLGELLGSLRQPVTPSSLEAQHRDWLERMNGRQEGE